MDYWKDVSGTGRRDYCVWGLVDKDKGMAALRALFPTGKADEMNFVLFSTSGVHGSFRTLEQEEREPGQGVTFMVVQPRLVMTRYGVVFPKNRDDFFFLARLRESSWTAMATVGGGR
jgi:hypothetical protein